MIHGYNNNFMKMNTIILLVPFKKNPKKIAPLILDSIKKFYLDGIEIVFLDPKKKPHTVQRKVIGVYDRYPSLLLEQYYSPWTENNPNLLHANSLSFIRFCQNKKKTQHCLVKNKIKMPKILKRPIKPPRDGFYIKPIFGSAGKDIRF